MLRIFEKAQKAGIKQYLETIAFRGGKVLDVGCGRGRYADLFEDYIGIDREAKEIEWARRKNLNARFEVMDAVKIDFEDNNFNFAFSICVFHHLSDESVTNTLREMWRVTREGGHILIIDLVLPRRAKFLAYPVFWMDKGAHIREFEHLSALLTNDVKPRFVNLKRFINLGVAVFEWQK